ncbi:hypothetical protein KR222_009069, partial [Zaprionus bogoriensis]
IKSYIDQRALLRMGRISSATDYKNDFKLHNNQPILLLGTTHTRAKRKQPQLPTAPRIIRFELSDAIAPQFELKDQRLLNQTVKAKTTTDNKDQEPRRMSRSAGHSKPVNFKVQFIPFKESDAREPDIVTARLIKQGRALDMQRKIIEKPMTIRENKRSKRSAKVQLVKFELADGKTSLPKSLITTETQAAGNVISQQKSRIIDNLITSGEVAAESKRIFFYDDNPLSMHAKAKKPISTLPHGVQKVITQIIKDGQVGKAYIKYLPPQNAHYEHLKIKSSSFSNVPPKLAQVQIEPITLVEQLRYVYNPSPIKTHPATPTISQPIIVHEAKPAEELHHTYSADMAVPKTEAAETHIQQAEISTGTSPFLPSKPDPLQVLQPIPIYGVPVEQFKYNIKAKSASPLVPLIKIEYHAPQSNTNEHYKELSEFQELSTLVGKSPDDQIHGLTYLLAKEMQAKQRQSKLLLDTQLHDRPQDNTAPIQFHPSQSQSQRPTLPSTLPQALPLTNHGLESRKFVGMAKTKQYVPILEPGNNDVKELPVTASKASAELPSPSSFIKFAPGHGLSNGYEGIHDDQPLIKVESVVHYPDQSIHNGRTSASLSAQLKGEMNGLHNHNMALQQYASKYAFGYRIRDSHTGNDFGHKQNRDLHGVTRGQYHILLPDGRVQNVFYHADDTGFHADVSFESASIK